MMRIDVRNVCTHKMKVHPVHVQKTTELIQTGIYCNKLHHLRLLPNIGKLSLSFKVRQAFIRYTNLVLLDKVAREGGIAHIEFLCNNGWRVVKRRLAIYDGEQRYCTSLLMQLLRHFKSNDAS